VREWISAGAIRDTAAFHSYLKSQGFMIRRTYKDVYGEKAPVMKEVVTLDGDIQTLQTVKDKMKLLAMSVLGNVVGKSEKAAAELDWKLRQATGIAKAKPAAEFVKMLTEQGEKVVLSVGTEKYTKSGNMNSEALIRSFASGSESPQQKAAGERIHRRSILQSLYLLAKVRRWNRRITTGFAYLRIWRARLRLPTLWTKISADSTEKDKPSRLSPISCTVDDGADPFMIERLGDKRSQHEGIFDGQESEAKIVESSTIGFDRLRALARVVPRPNRRANSSERTRRRASRRGNECTSVNCQSPRTQRGKCRKPYTEFCRRCLKPTSNAK
jgi:hypothetical protein